MAFPKDALFQTRLTANKALGPFSLVKAVQLMPVSQGLCSILSRSFLEQELADRAMQSKPGETWKSSNSL